MQEGKGGRQMSCAVLLKDSGVRAQQSKEQKVDRYGM